MSKMKAFIERLVENRETVLVNVPGSGYVHARVESIQEDIVTIDPEKGSKIILHYTQFSVKLE